MQEYKMNKETILMMRYNNKDLFESNKISKEEHLRNSKYLNYAEKENLLLGSSCNHSAQLRKLEVINLIFNKLEKLNYN